MSSQGQYYY
uniref:Uncharacterized protein n=1 Tax=Amphimedon queenslandica TaxID=400682 RepID=A0A1X7SVL3_AMPQE